MDLKGAVVIANLYGNLMSGTERHMSNWYEIPLVTNAAIVSLRRGEGTVTVFEGSLYVDFDRDGVDFEAECQFEMDDHKVDSNGNGISDYNEIFGTNPAVTNGPPGTNGPPVPHPVPPRPPPPRKISVIFIDHEKGNDSYTGASPIVAPTERKESSSPRQDGPKLTIRNGLRAAESEGAKTLIIKTGKYNEDLNIRGKRINVRIQGNVRL